MRIVFIGPPGAGKGTQCARLTGFLGIPHLSTGEILRVAKQNETPLGRVVGPIMDSGELVSDDLMMGVISERLAHADCRDGYLLDGFPRTVPQAEALCVWIQATGQRLDHVIELRVDKDELRNRLSMRFRNLSNPRADDRPELIIQRLLVYQMETKPLVNFYAARDGLLKTINGIGTMDDVFHRILVAIGLEKPAR